MLTNDERREVAARLRDYEGLREAFMESPLCAFLDALGVEGYIDWNRVINILADLIEPEPERTCKNLSSGSLFVCSECNGQVTKWRVMPNYCPNCGAKVVE